MKTITVTEARRNLTCWLKAAKDGEEIGIIFGADVFALRQVPIQAADYGRREFGMTPLQLSRFASRMDAELDSERKAGRMKVFTSTIPRRRGRWRATLKKVPQGIR